MKSKEEIIAFRLIKSEDAIKEALLLHEGGFWSTTASRLYYAAFYVVSALLFKQGVETKTHSGQKNKFNELFIKTCLLDEELGAFYNELFLYRQESDYEDFAAFDAEEIEPLIEQTKKFVKTIQDYLNKHQA